MLRPRSKRATRSCQKKENKGGGDLSALQITQGITPLKQLAKHLFNQVQR